jgi:hypothetical protein
MFHDTRIAGNFYQVRTRIEENGALARWATHEPALAGMVSVDEITAATDRTGRATVPGQADAVLGALLRRANTHTPPGSAGRDSSGGDGRLALLLVLHLQSDWITALARELTDLAPDVLNVIVGELTCRIRNFPHHQRDRAYAANLRGDTRKAVLAALCPGPRGKRTRPVDPACLTARLAAMESATIPTPRGGDGNASIEWAALSSWAVTTGVAEPAELGLIQDLETARLTSEHADECIAATHGISPRTLYRRRASCLARLRAHASDYLAAGA